MHSFDALMALIFAAAVNAVQFTNANYDIAAGRSFTITWSGNAGPVTIFLKNSTPANLQTVNTVVSGAQGNSFVWIPSASLPNDVYVLEIDDDGQNDPNYSPQFQYSGGQPLLPSTSMTGSMTMTSSTSATDSSSTDASMMTSSLIISSMMTDTSMVSSSMMSSLSSIMSSASSSMTAIPNVSKNSTTMSMSMSETRSSSSASAPHTSTGRGSTSATGSRTSESATPIKTGDTSAAGRLVNPIALVVFACGVLAFFN